MEPISNFCFTLPYKTQVAEGSISLVLCLFPIFFFYVFPCLHYLLWTTFFCFYFWISVLIVLIRSFNTKTLTDTFISRKLHLNMITFFVDLPYLYFKQSILNFAKTVSANLLRACPHLALATMH